MLPFVSERVQESATFGLRILIHARVGSVGAVAQTNQDADRTDGPVPASNEEELVECDKHHAKQGNEVWAADDPVLVHAPARVLEPNPLTIADHRVKPLEQGLHVLVEETRLLSALAHE